MLDDAHVGDIKGAFGTIAHHDTAPRTGWRVCARCLPSLALASSSWFAITTPARSAPRRKPAELRHVAALDARTTDPGFLRQPGNGTAPARLTSYGLAHGIALYNRRANRGKFGDIQLIASPLIITEPEIDDLVERLGRSLLDFERDLEREGALD